MDRRSSAEMGGGDGATRTKAAQERFNRKLHLFYLSQPKPQALLPYPDPAYYVDLPRPIPQQALKYVPTKRIKIMSSPIESKITPKYEKPEKQDRTVEPAALLAVATPRVIELAKPVTRGYKKSSKTKDKKKSQSTFAEGKVSKKSKKYKQSQAAAIAAAAAERENWFLKNAVPRKWPPTEHPHPDKPRFIMRGKNQFFIKEKKKLTVTAKETTKISLDELYRDCVLLSLPPKRREKFKYVTEKDNFAEIRRRKLAVPPTDHIKRLAQAKQLHPEAELDLKYNPHKVTVSALRYKANERILALATPIKKTARVDSDVKMDPFGVVKRALKAICTKRVAELAIPVNRE
ncbi:Hypothetical protein NTJ_05823 [Nesidiocoris tenuis]|uniref:Testicular haploid expressed gene protein-like n=1 Tax=Nesidiocoris tenuis TaxID=355587 RepID=A0ABN7AL88_9HEMI|nr:Hypothetical protein NTJ_05823 [Nesidiocoris tenuis]